MIGHWGVGRSRHLSGGHHVGGICGRVSACGTGCAVGTRMVVVAEVVLAVGSLGARLVCLRK